MSFSINAKKEGNILLFELSGNLDASTIPAFEEKIKELKDDTDPKIVLDMKMLEFISSAGWSIFVETAKVLREKNGDLKFADMRATAQRIYSLMGLDAWIQGYPDTKTAVASYDA